MRKFRRLTEPDVLTENSERWNRQWVELRESNSSAKFNWYQHEGKSARDWIIDDLFGLTDGHCSFCDRFTVEPESIEHFKPKSKPEFANLAYSWSNLYFCCGGCQNHKKEKWDERLLRPDDENYSFLKYFNFDFGSGKIFPNPCSSVEDQQRAEVTIEIYGLDSEKRRRFRKTEFRRWSKSTSTEREIDDFAYRDFLEIQT